MPQCRIPAFAGPLGLSRTLRAAPLLTTCTPHPLQVSFLHRSVVCCAQEAPPVVAPAELRGKDGGGGPSGSPDPRSRDLAVTLAWVAVAAATAGGFQVFEGSERALEFVAGYIVEYSLSVDNLFVFLLIFSNFKVDRKSQERVLTYGILGALIMRGAMILVGAELTRRFEVVTLAFAALLLYSGVKLLVENEEEEEDMEKNPILKFARRVLTISEKYDGDKFFTVENGVRMATPLFLVVVCVELSDVIFALDSVPAVLGISTDTKVVYLSNILAIMGLRNLYFLLSSAIGDLRFLQPALGILLSFVGGKMIAGVAGYHIDILPSLGVIAATLGGGVGLSLAFPEPEEAENNTAE